MERGWLRRIHVSGVPIDIVGIRSACDIIVSRVTSGRGGIVVTPNTSIARQISSPMFKDVRAKAVLWLPDGAPITWLAWIQGSGSVDRVTGADLLVEMLHLARTVQVRIVVIGAGANALIRHERSVLSSTQLSGGDLPYGEADSSSLLDAVKEYLPAEPCVVFLGLGFPKQELVAARLLDSRRDCVVIGSGAAAQMKAGEIRRAPEVFQKIGIEWLWRVFQDPRRLFGRYVLRDLPWFIWKFLATAVQRGWSRIRV